MSEWTVEELDGCAVLNRHDGSVPMQFTYISGIKEIAEAHNAALAKARLEAHNYWSQAVDSAQHQLAAERDDRISWQELYEKTKQQLAAELGEVQTYEGALIKIANDLNCDRCQVAVDALAKVAK